MNSEPHRAGWPAQKTTKESALREFYGVIHFAARTAGTWPAENESDFIADL
jgi:hypothetical protein